MRILDFFKRNPAPRNDGWQNMLTGIGSYKQDATTRSISMWERMESEEAESIYASDKMCRRIINIPTVTALTHGYRLSYKEMKEEDMENFNNDRNDLLDRYYDLPHLIKTALIWARIYGVSYLLPGYNDGGQELSQPLDMSRVKKVDYFKLFGPRELFPLIPNFNALSPNYLYPQFYTLATWGGVPIDTAIHYSRVIRCEGQHLPRNLFVHNGYKHDSFIGPLREPLSDYSTAIKALSTMLKEYSVGVYKTKGLHDLLLSGNELKFLKKLKAMDQAKSLINSLVIDADQEDYERKSGNFSGVSEIVDDIRKDLATKSDIPHTILFNEGPGHAGASHQSSGKSEVSDWQEKVFNYQKDEIKPVLIKVYSAIFNSKENPLKSHLKEKEVSNFEILFTPGRTMSLEEEAEAYMNFSAADDNYLNQGTITPQEVRVSRFGRFGTFSRFGSKIQIEQKTKASDDFVSNDPEGPGEMGEFPNQNPNPNPNQDPNQKGQEASGKNNPKR